MNGATLPAVGSRVSTATSTDSSPSSGSLATSGGSFLNDQNGNPVWVQADENGKNIAYQSPSDYPDNPLNPQPTSLSPIPDYEQVPGSIMCAYQLDIASEELTQDTVALNIIDADRSIYYDPSGSGILARGPSELRVRAIIYDGQENPVTEKVVVKPRGAIIYSDFIDGPELAKALYGAIESLTNETVADYRKWIIDGSQIGAGPAPSGPTVYSFYIPSGGSIDWSKFGGFIVEYDYEEGGQIETYTSTLDATLTSRTGTIIGGEGNPIPSKVSTIYDYIDGNQVATRYLDANNNELSSEDYSFDFCPITQYSDPIDKIYAKEVPKLITGPALESSAYEIGGELQIDSGIVKMECIAVTRDGVKNTEFSAVAFSYGEADDGIYLDDSNFWESFYSTYERVFGVELGSASQGGEIQVDFSGGTQGTGFIMYIGGDEDELNKIESIEFAKYDADGNRTGGRDNPTQGVVERTYPSSALKTRTEFVSGYRIITTLDGKPVSHADYLHDGTELPSDWVDVPINEIQHESRTVIAAEDVAIEIAARSLRHLAVYPQQGPVIIYTNGIESTYAQGLQYELGGNGEILTSDFRIVVPAGSVVRITEGS